jgi:hypothetical protein
MQYTYELNTLGPLRVTKALLPNMIAEKVMVLHFSQENCLTAETQFSQCTLLSLYHDLPHGCLIKMNEWYTRDYLVRQRLCTRRQQLNQLDKGF